MIRLKRMIIIVMIGVLWIIPTFSEGHENIDIRVENYLNDDVFVPAKYIFEKYGYTIDALDHQILIRNSKKQENIFVNVSHETIGERLYVPKKLADEILGNEIKASKEIPILMYHHMLKKRENRYKNNESVIHVEDFEEQMKYLHEQGYYTIKPEELKKYLKGEICLPEKSIMITFDDGHRSNFVYAYPIMKKYGFKGTIFMITKVIYEDKVEFNPKQMQYLSYKEMNQSKDVFTFGSHTHNLHYLNNRNKSYLICKSKEEIKKDLKQSMKILNTKYIAYPYGHYRKNTIDILKELGFELAFTVQKGKVRVKDDSFQLKRMAINHRTTFKKFKSMVQ